MEMLPFIKCTAYGNSFIIVDETVENLLTETEKLDFAYQATNMCFGIGSDNLLIIQPCNVGTLRAINNTHHYWEELPNPASADFIFRMFEPNGAEALCCGNGLMCIANLLYQKYGLTSARIMTEIPLAKPNVISVGSVHNQPNNWVNLGHPKRVSTEIVNSSMLSRFNDHIDFIAEIKINFENFGIQSFATGSCLYLSGYLVFTGEPHLVILLGENSEIARSVFKCSDNSTFSSKMIDEMDNAGACLVHYIGSYINKHYRDEFPVGINVNFVRMSYGSNELEYRCFERGINRETSACGTGALAVSYVARHLNIFNMKKIDVLPHRCRWYEPEARIQVEESDSGWLLKGNAKILFQGHFEAAFSKNRHDNLVEFGQRKRQSKHFNGNRALPVMKNYMIG